MSCGPRIHASVVSSYGARGPRSNVEVRQFHQRFDGHTPRRDQPLYLALLVSSESSASWRRRVCVLSRNPPQSCAHLVEHRVNARPMFGARSVWLQSPAVAHVQHLRQTGAAGLQCAATTRTPQDSHNCTTPAPLRPPAAAKPVWKGVRGVLEHSSSGAAQRRDIAHTCARGVGAGLVHARLTAPEQHEPPRGAGRARCLSGGVQTRPRSDAL
jgi:hypothetical protein